MHLLRPRRLLRAGSLLLPALLLTAFLPPVQEDGGAPKDKGKDEDATPWLVLETPQGTTRRIRAGSPVLTDPRTEGTWIVRVEGAAPPASAASDSRPLVEVQLTGGDRLRGHLAGAKDETLQVAIAEGVVVPLAIDSIARVTLPGNLPASLAAPLEAPSEGDRVYRRTGSSLDRDDGAVVGFDADGVRFESELLGQRSIPWSELGALFVEGLSKPANPEAGTGKGVPVVVDLTDASRLRGRVTRIDVDGVALVVGTDAALTLPLAHVALLTVDDGTLAYLSDLDPEGEVGAGAPFGDDLGLSLPAQLDRSVVGGPLVVGGTTWPRGIGTHAPTRVRWKLAPEWTRLRGSVGIDDSTARLPRDARGSVVFRVRVDDQVVWESGVVHGGDGPVAMPAIVLPEGEAERVLELESDPVDDFRGDRADWLGLVLYRP